MRFSSLVCSFLLFSSANAIIPDTLKDYKVVLTYGEPLVTSGGAVLVMSWDDCVQKCHADPNCVLVHDTTPTCRYFNIEHVTSVRKLNSGSRVGFRVRTRTTQCYLPEYEPVLTEGTVESDVQRSHETYGLNQYIPIRITLKDDVWTFAQREEPFSCFPGTELMRRGGSIWCMSVITSGSCITQSRANQMCMDAYQERLAGPASVPEFEYIRNRAMKYLNDPSSGNVPTNYTQLGFWLDGVRKKECYFPKKTGATCSGNSEFVFSDVNAPNPALGWLEGQPDGLSKRTNGDCVYFMARNTDGDGVDDLQCTTPQYAALNLCMVGYYCGTNLGEDTWN